MKKVVFFLLITSVVGCNSTSNKTKMDDQVILAPAIRVDSAQIMTGIYDPTRTNITKNTKAVWLSLKRIRNLYLGLQKDSIANNGATDGIRIYFATYPKEYKPGHSHPHKDRNTLIFVSTKDSLKYHSDYFYKEKVLLLIEPENRGELCPNNCEGAKLYKP